MLDDRKTAILSAVVQEYIATALPVGSTHIADAPGVRVSSATVRNEMAVLEQEGYLVQPHTSAGRIPTDKGYRFFVDHLVRPAASTRRRSSQVGDFFRTAHGRLEEMLHRTSDLLAHLTNYAAVVVGPRAEASPCAACRSSASRRRWPRSSSCSATAPSRARRSTLADDVSDAQLAAASAHLTAQLVGSSLAAVASVVPSGDDDRRPAVRRRAPAPSASVQRRARLRRRHVGDGLGVRRRRHRPRRAAHARAAVRRRVAARRPRPARDVRRDRRRARGRAAVGCSVVVAPVVVDGEQRGSVGVLGPTRMNYPQALATVEVVSDRLGRRLED